MLSLELEKRVAKGKKLAPFRKEGKLPVVVYGHGIKSSLDYFVSLKDFEKVYNDVGESSLVSLADGDKKRDVLVHDVARHPLSGRLLHADFLAIDVSKPVEVEVELNFVGVSPAVKNLGGILLRVMHTIEISVLPKNLPNELIVDLTKLENIDDQLEAKDIKLPEGATLITDSDETIVIVSEPKEEKEEVAPVDLATAVKVEEKGKKPAEGEGDVGKKES